MLNLIFNILFFMQIDGYRQIFFPKHKAVTLPRELRVFATAIGKMGKDLLLPGKN